MSDSDPNLNDELDHGSMDQFSAHLDRGWDLLHRGDYPGALLSAEKSLELDSQSPEAHNLLGYVRALQGDAEEALEHYKQAIALDDGFVEAMLNAAEVLIHPIHDFEAAMAMVDEALELAEGDDEVADALLLKFDAYMHQGKREDAARVASQLPNSAFENPRLDFLVGRAHFEAGDTSNALQVLARATEREPDNPDGFYYLALTQEAAGNPTAATLAFLRTRELDLHLPHVAWSLPRTQFEARVRAVIERLEPPLKAALANALVLLSDTPGVEIVAEGVDPRAALVLDATGKKDEPPYVGRMFVYQRNVERHTESPLTLEDDLLRILKAELAASFDSLAAYAPADEGPEA